MNAVLDGHVGMPRDVKEINFFSHYYDKGVDWYTAHFRHCNPNGPVGVVCPVYFGSRAALERIAFHIPDCRIVVTLRDPVERAYSHYKMMRHYAFVRDITFEQALETRSEIMDANLYSRHLRAWRNKFGKDRVLVCLFDDLRHDPHKFVNRICQFIGAPPIDPGRASGRGRNVGSFDRMPRNLWLARRARKIRMRLKERQFYKTIRWMKESHVWDFCFGRGEQFPPINPDTRDRLFQELLPEIEATEELIGRDLSAWKYPYALQAQRRAYR